MMRAGMTKKNNIPRESVSSAYSPPAPRLRRAGAFRLLLEHTPD